jgi:phage shock protein A
MGIFSRMSDIVNANINAMLDRAEDPDKMVRMIIQEMEDTLVEVRSNSAKLLAERKELTRKKGALEKQASHWSDNAVLALSKEREDLARAALQEKRLIEGDIEALQEELDATDEHLNHLQDEIAQLHQKLSDARAKQQALGLKGRTVESRLQVKRQLQRRALDDAFSRFEQFERKMDRLEGELEALDMESKAGQDLASEIRALAEDERLNSELQALKERLAKSQSVQTDQSDKLDK